MCAHYIGTFSKAYNAYKYSVRMLSKMNYQKAVETLNTLQSNKAALELMRKDIQNGKGCQHVECTPAFIFSAKLQYGVLQAICSAFHKKKLSMPTGRVKCTHLEEMEKYLQRAQISVNKLDELAVVHVAGTKGKGSTSAMCESILRCHGFRTGFFSSPHLVVVRERIRINGIKISEEKFSQYFSDIFIKLDATKDDSDDMPKYFHFLTVMAFHAFLNENVDVAIFEVGIGGNDDSTNIIRNPYVVGITALGLDHTSILGNTIEEIAKAKAGIMKPGCEAYTVNQPLNAMAVLQAVARDRKCQLHLVPDYAKYDFAMGSEPTLQINNEAYKTNASLAIQLAHAWLRKRYDNTKIFNNINKIQNITLNTERGTKRKHSSANQEHTSGNENNKDLGKLIYTIPKNTVSGVSACVWPGRYQRMNTIFAEFFLDGAHTKESLDICVSWFNKHSSEKTKILIFSATGDRNSETLLKSLIAVEFETVYFVVPMPYKEINEKNDAYSIQQHSDMVARCEIHSKQWSELNVSHTDTFVHGCISDVLKHMRERFEFTNKRASVLVTGSLYLVGGALAILDPNMN